MRMDGRPVLGVICTHMHPDHIGQAKHITDRFRCPLYMTQGEYFQARAFANSGGNSQSGWIGEKFYVQAGMPKDYLEQLAKMWASRSSEGMSMPTMVQGYERLQDGQILRIGDNDWQIVVGSGHSPEHACLYSSALKVLISGDQNFAHHHLERECAPHGAERESAKKLDGVPRSLLGGHSQKTPSFCPRTICRFLESSQGCAT